MQNNSGNEPHTPRVFAIVPAAGRGRRMGRCKPLIEIDGVPMLLGIIARLRAARLGGIVIVTRHEIEDALMAHPLGRPHMQSWREASSPEIALAYNESAGAEMIDSVRIGLRLWTERAKLANDDGLLVCPADHPRLSTEDVDNCIAAFQAAPGKIILASRNGRRGHPIIFPSSLADVVNSSACDDGLNALPRNHAERVCEAECASPGVLNDVDTPEDLENL